MKSSDSSVYQGINDKTFIYLAVVYLGICLGLNMKGIERDLKTKHGGIK